MEKIKEFTKSQIKTDLPDIRPGDTVKVYQRIKDPTQKDSKERTQFFEGQIISRKHGKEIGSTITVRRITGKIEVEKIFPLHSPTIEKIEVLKRGKVRRSKLYYLRNKKGKKGKLKTKEVFDNKPEEKEKPAEEEKETQEEPEEKKEISEKEESPKEEPKEEPSEEEPNKKEGEEQKS
jgi:large subunit ribosomal protein L19